MVKHKHKNHLIYPVFSNPPSQTIEITAAKAKKGVDEFTKHMDPCDSSDIPKSWITDSLHIPTRFNELLHVRTCVRGLTFFTVETKSSRGTLAFCSAKNGLLGRFSNRDRTPQGLLRSRCLSSAAHVTHVTSKSPPGLRIEGIEPLSLVTSPSTRPNRWPPTKHVHWKLQ